MSLIIPITDIPQRLLHFCEYSAIRSFISFYLAVMRTVQVLEAASHQLTIDQLEQLIILENTDELGQVGQSLNNVAATLFKANKDITELNRRLEAENPRMEAELAITRRLQEMILPKEPEFQTIQGLEIAGFMPPATEVGGDYYGVPQEGGPVKLAIGDVTGHGSWRWRGAVHGWHHGSGE